MKNRDYREFAAGEIYHLYNRGNGKMDIFRNARDYEQFLLRLFVLLGASREDVDGDKLTDAKLRLRLAYFGKGTFELICYCCMPNHFHLALRQCAETPLSELILKLCTSYSMYLNRKYEHSGHVFQGRFMAVRIENDRQLKHLSAYIHLNPRVARLVNQAESWPHSSYSEYLGITDTHRCEKSVVLDQFRSHKAYEAFVEDSFEDIDARKMLRTQIEGLSFD